MRARTPTASRCRTAASHLVFAADGRLAERQAGRDAGRQDRSPRSPRGRRHRPPARRRRQGAGRPHKATLGPGKAPEPDARRQEAGRAAAALPHPRPRPAGAQDREEARGRAALRGGAAAVRRRLRDRQRPEASEGLPPRLPRPQPAAARLLRPAGGLRPEPRRTAPRRAGRASRRAAGPVPGPVHQPGAAQARQPVGRRQRPVGRRLPGPPGRHARPAAALAGRGRSRRHRRRPAGGTAAAPSTTSARTRASLFGWCAAVPDAGPGRRRQGSSTPRWPSCRPLFEDVPGLRYAALRAGPLPVEGRPARGGPQALPRAVRADDQGGRAAADRRRLPRRPCWATARTRTCGASCCGRRRPS